MLTLATIRAYCLSKKGVVEDFPFDFTTLVFKVGGKIFVLTDVDAKELRLNLKCDPYLSLQLRSQYAQIQPGYHMNKKHWNTILVDGTIPDKEIYGLIDHSYELVYAKISRKIKEELKAME